MQATSRLGSFFPDDLRAARNQAPASQAPGATGTTGVPGAGEGVSATTGAAGASATGASPTTGAAGVSATTAAPTTEELYGEYIDVDDLLEESVELALARAEAEEYRDRYLRLQAEWDNYRKRTSLEREAERGRASAHLVEKLLPIIDDLERAIEHSDTADALSLQEGIQAVYAKLEDVLSKQGVVTINPLGEPFDAHKHSAVGIAVDALLPEETVVQVYQKGYEMAGRLLRSAMVIVSTR